MLSLRSLARSVPRTACAFSSQCARPSLRTLQRPTTLSFAWRHSASLRPGAAFSTTQRHFESEGEVNAELAAKLENELSMEKDMRDPEAFPSHLKEYIDNSGFELEDSPGTEDVILTRQFGDEKIRISFTIDDLNNIDEDPDQLQEDSSMMDELDDPADMPNDGQSGGANSKGAIKRGRTSNGNIRVAPEDSVSPADRDELAEDDMEEDGEREPQFPANLNIVIERPNKGTLQIEAVAQDGLIVIENVYYFKDGSKTEAVPAGEFQKETYTGPPFGNLDEDLQVLFERYIEERGINTQMALFVPEYIDFKEQREYLSWLNGVKNFVE